MTIARIKTRWSGFVGSPGVTVSYASTPATFRDGWKVLLNSMINYFPSLVTMTVEAQGDLLDEATGVITGEWSSGTESSYTGTITGGSYAAPVGFGVRWNTPSIFDGHRIKGRTFFVPCSSVLFDSDGTIKPTYLAEAQGFVNSFMTVTPPTMVVWHRPIPAGAPRGPRAGGFAGVTSGTVQDKATVLRSRRD